MRVNNEEHGMRLLRDLLLIDPTFEAKLEHEKAGIDLPEYAVNSLPWRGKVLEIGLDVKLRGLIGKTIIFDRMHADTGNLNKTSGHKVKIDNKDMYFLPENLILAVIE